MSNKMLFLIIILVISFVRQSMGQVITAAMPARLQVYVQRQDGLQVMLTSENLEISYDQLEMAGELKLESLHAQDDHVAHLLDSLAADIEALRFSGSIPEGKFVFGDALDEQFSVETKLQFGGTESRIMLEFVVSNRKTSLANTFQITCSGYISMKDDLGIEDTGGYDDRISFQFVQNLQTKNY